MEKYLEAGKIVNTHGVRGDVKIEAWCDSPEVLASLKRLYVKDKAGDFKALDVERASVHKHMALCKIAGVNDVDGALAYKNVTVYADREDIPVPEGGHFIADLIGLPVTDARNGRVYGKLKEVMNRGASDIYVIDTGNGGEAMLPAVSEFVERVDIDNGIYVTPIEGIFGEDE